MMNQERLAALFHEGFEAIGMAPCSSAIDRFVVYVGELCRGNAAVNLTGHTREREIVGNLFLDSLVWVKTVGQEKPSSVLDIGSGAGFPGMPIHILSSRHEMTLLEPNLKKVAFLHHIIGRLGLRNVRVEPRRMDQLAAQSEFHGQFDWALIKALRLDDGLSSVCPVLSASGKCVLWRASPLPALNQRRLSVLREIPYELPFGLGKRLLSIVERENL